MNKLILTSILLLGLNTFATSGKTPPANNGSGAVQCAWYDAGSTEEHGPHISYQDCMASGHGSCQERCYSYEQVCKTDGVRTEVLPTAPGQQPVVKEVVTTFEARDRDMYRAREMSIYRCQQAWPLQQSCRTTSCTEDTIRVR